MRPVGCGGLSVPLINDLMKMISALLNEIPGIISTQQKYLLKVFNMTAVIVMTNVPDLHTVTMEMLKLS